MNREVQVGKASGISCVTTKAYHITLFYFCSCSYKYPISSQVGVERHRAIMVLNGNEVGIVSVAISGTIISVHHSAISCRKYLGADAHGKIITILPKPTVPETGSISLIYLKSTANSVW